MLSLQHNGEMPCNSALQLSSQQILPTPKGCAQGNLNNQESEGGLCVCDIKVE